VLLCCFLGHGGVAIPIPRVKDAACAVDTWGERKNDSVAVSMLLTRIVLACSCVTMDDMICQIDQVGECPTEQ
jgi:hypothetical protein